MKNYLMKCKNKNKYLKMKFKINKKNKIFSLYKFKSQNNKN